jgi:hypothetical protein
VWGRYRARAAYGDGTCTGADTSLYCALYGAKWVLDSVLTAQGYPGRMSTFAIAPDDDWTPKTIRPLGGGPTIDSVLWAVRRAGFTGIRYDGLEGKSFAHLSRTNPRGFYKKQRTLRESVGGGEITLLGHSGYPVMGSHSWIQTFNDSAAPFDSGLGFGGPGHENCRIMSAFTQDNDYIDADAWNNSLVSDVMTSYKAWNDWVDIQFPQADWDASPVKGYVVRLCANDLSGVQNQYGPPARNGYWAIKRVHSLFNTINSFAGRTVIRLGYPDEVLP